MRDFTKIRLLLCLLALIFIFFALVTPIHVLGWISRVGIIFGGLVAILTLIGLITEGEE